MKNSTFQRIVITLLGIVAAYILVLIGLNLYTYSKTRSVERTFNPPINVVQEKRPSYEYLKSVTLYMVHPNLKTSTDTNFHGAVGTGIVIALKGNEYYLLTNKHICDQEVDNCYTTLTGNLDKEDLIRLTYVKSAKNVVDLELWKVDQTLLPGKTVIKGLKPILEQERVYSVGNYLGLTYIYTEGTKAGHFENGDLFNLPCAFGCSGSGIFNADGYLVSVLYAGNGVPTTFPLIQAFDTAKVVGVDYLDTKEFVGDLINE